MRSSNAVRIGIWSTRWRKPATTTTVQAVVLACAGRTFIAGADITEFGKPPHAARAPAT